MRFVQISLCEISSVIALSTSVRYWELKKHACFKPQHSDPDKQILAYSRSCFPGNVAAIYETRRYITVFTWTTIKIMTNKFCKSISMSWYFTCLKTRWHMHLNVVSCERLKFGHQPRLKEIAQQQVSSESPLFHLLQCSSFFQLSLAQDTLNNCNS
jgi:hypothetical protein